MLKIKKQKYKIIRLPIQHTRAQQERGRGGDRAVRGPLPAHGPTPRCLEEQAPHQASGGSGLAAGTLSTQAVFPGPGPFLLLLLGC